MTNKHLGSDHHTFAIEQQAEIIEAQAKEIEVLRAALREIHDYAEHWMDDSEPTFTRLLMASEIVSMAYRVL